jgi:hypothetical protein
MHMYYGDGEILHGSKGVNLHRFNCVGRWVTRSEEKTLIALHNRLMQGFQLNATTHKLKVQALVSRASVGYFGELIPINSVWCRKMYVYFAMEREHPLILLAHT